MNPALNVPPPSSNAAIIDGSTATFMEDVIQASVSAPVIVDFWAPWCGPCKTLTPLLERLVAAQNGKVKLVKIDIDKNQQLAAQMRVQSVPTVFAFFQGQPVDAFQGALPESQLKQFIEKLAKLGGGGTPDLTPIYAEAAAALTAGQLDMAEAIYADIINAIPSEAVAQIGLLRVQLLRGNVENVKAVIADLPDDVKKHKDFPALQSAVELAEQSAAAGPLDDLQKAVAANPADNAKRFDLANAQFAAGDVEGAADNLFAIMKQQRDWNDDAARKQLLKICQTIGLEDPRSKAIRRRLSEIIFI
ncbi:MAG: thioredoxin [Bdellovibrionales bacterium]